MLCEKFGNFVCKEFPYITEKSMSIRCKFEGGKVINRSQSGSWEFRCIGAGLRKNLGSSWGPQTWMVQLPIKLNLGKETEKAEETRRKSKYA